MKKTILLILAGLFVIIDTISAQNLSNEYDDGVKARMRIIIDNDFCGDPDGLFQLVQHLLSPSVEIKAIIGSHLYRDGFYGKSGTAGQSCRAVKELLSVMQLSDKYPVLPGAEDGLSFENKPRISEGAEFIVKEAMRDNKMPLYIVCGAGLTNIASAYLMEPKIAKRIKLIWIGGAEYPDLGIPLIKSRPLEYNLGIDIIAARVIFNNSNITLWQVPRNTYRQALYSLSEIRYRLQNQGAIGEFLISKLDNLMYRAKYTLGEAYVLGDSPLVLLTALQSGWEADPSSCDYVVRNSPIISENGNYQDNPLGRPVRIYTQIDKRLMWEDFVSKLAIENSKNKMK